MLDALLASKVKSSSDAYRILLSVESKFVKKHITDVFSSDFDINEIMSVALKGKNDDVQEHLRIHCVFSVLQWSLL